MTETITPQRIRELFGYHSDLEEFLDQYDDRIERCHYDAKCRASEAFQFALLRIAATCTDPTSRAMAENAAYGRPIK